MNALTLNIHQNEISQNKHKNNIGKGIKPKTTKSTEQNPNLNPNLIQPVKGKITSRKTHDATKQSVTKQNSNSKNIATQPQNHTNPNANENQGNVYIIMDSNRKFINFKELRTTV